MASFLQNFRIRTKLLLILLLAGIPIIISTGYLLLAKYRTDYREAEHAIMVTAEAIAAQHVAHVDGIRTLLITISQFPEVKRRDSEASSRLLQAILKQNPSSHNIGIADPTGKLIASGVNAKFAIGDRKYFQDALRNKRFSVGEYTVSRAVAKPAIHFALPVLDEAGEVSVVVYATFDLTHFNSIFVAQKLPPNSALNITDHSGVLIHRFPEHPTVKPGLQDRPDLRAHMTGDKSEGVFNDIGRDGVKRFLAFKRLQLHADEAPYMYVRVSIPEQEALASIHQQFGISVALFFVAALITLWCTRLFAGRVIVAPLERLADVAKAAQNADFTARTGLEYGHDEVGMLARTLDSMSESLETRNRERERAEQERLLIEQELHESERRFRELLGGVHLVAVMLDREGNITFGNDYLLELTGWSHDEIIGKSWFSLFIPPEHTDEVRRLFIAAIAALAIPPHYENPIITRSGAKRSIVWDNTILMNSDGTAAGTASIGIDVTDQRSIEAQLLQSQKMEAVGKLAGGVAHDFNNLLTPILGYAEMLTKELATLGGKVDRAERIIKAALKARDLTRQLLTFGRKQPLDMQPLDLNAVITSFAEILQRTIRESVEIQLQLMPEWAGILADKTQLEQILMNLVINAQDAIDDTGRITIETTRVTLDEPAARLHADLLPGTYIMLTVSDTGHGIDQQTLGEIFEPFFTTKGPDKGTGLGLATVHGIVRQHGGTIGVQSESGKGTTFTVYFPFFGQATPLLPEAPEQLRIRGNKTGSILLVEDNETVRQLVHDLLAGDGYEVVEALNPQQALELAHDKEIDLLVTDVVMPGMSGLELHKQLLTTNPGIKALFMSGYTGTAISEQNKLFSSDAFIQKPFTVDTMLNKVASILGIPS